MGWLKRICASKAGEYTLVLFFFFLLTVVFTWPLILHPHNAIIGEHGDPLLNTWIISWDARTIFTHPTRFFQGNIIYPSRDVLAYSEHQFTLGIIAAPVYFISHNPILAYNFLVFLCFVLSGFGSYLLVKELTGSRWGGLTAGVFYSFCFYKISQLSHIQIFFSAFLPFMLLYLYRYLRQGRFRNLFLFALFFVAQSLVSWHYLIYCAIAAGLIWVWTAVFSRGREEWMRLLAVAAALAVAALVILPFALPYFRAHQRLPNFERSLEEVKLYGAKGEDYRRVLDVSVVYGEAPSPFKEGGIGYENVLYPGVVILILAAAGVALRGRGSEKSLPLYGPASFRGGPLFFLILGGLAFFLTYGPEIVGRWNPFYMIPYNLGLLKFTRVPTRFFILVAMSLAVLGGYGTAKIALRASSGGNGSRRSGRLAGAALVVLLVLEILTFDLAVYPIPVNGDVPDVYEWLSGQGDVQVIELPTCELGPANFYDRDLKLAPLDIFEYLYREGDVMYFSAYHWKQVVNGYSGYSPFFYRRIMTEMQGFPSGRSINLLRGLGVDYVVWDWTWVPEQRMEEYSSRLFSTPGLGHVGDFQHKSVFRVEAGETASLEQMRVEAVAPRAVPPGTGCNLGLLVSNPTSAPMVCVEEEYQAFTLRLEDETGRTVEIPGKYRAPFFVDAGETISLPLQAGKAMELGRYRGELRLGSGVLGERSFELALEVGEVPDWDAGGGNASIASGTQAFSMDAPDGLCFLATVTVTNRGETMLRAMGQLEDYSLPKGAAYVGLMWKKGDGEGWGNQSCSLPCDVAPGQSVEVPMLLRRPGAPGEYDLDVGIYVEGIGLIGEPVRLRVTVEGWGEAASRSGGT